MRRLFQINLILIHHTELSVDDNTRARDKKNISFTFFTQPLSQLAAHNVSKVDEKVFLNLPSSKIIILEAPAAHLSTSGMRSGE